MPGTCVVFVCNKTYFEQFVRTCTALLTNGRYKGDICLAIGDDLVGDTLLESPIIKQNNIEVKHFKNIVFTDEFMESIRKVNTDGRNITKQFQWHKLYLFDMYFKKWDYIFYIDCGMKILADISPMLRLCEENVLLAHSDAYPTYEWRLHTQFDKTLPQFKNLNALYNLNIDYFQSTILLYHTQIIEADTFNNLYNLALEYPISRTNEQAIMALYFTNIKPLFKQIKICDENTYYYDFMRRNGSSKYIMYKY